MTRETEHDNWVDEDNEARTDANPPLVAVDALSVWLGAERVPVVRDVSWRQKRREVVALVGESGCGKTMTALALLGLLPTGAVTGGRWRFDGEDVRDHAAIRGRRVGMIFQEPGSALNPVITIGSQLLEVLAVHRGLRGAAARAEAVALLERVAMPDAVSRMRAYAHQLSGGQQQRAVIALALAARPELLIADEPTTALDVTVQAQILDLLADLRRDLGLAVLLISHDFGVVAEIADRVMVMHAGKIVESADVETFFVEPRHPYSRALLAARPTLGQTVTVGTPGVVSASSALPEDSASHPRREPVDTRRVETPLVADGVVGMHRPLLVARAVSKAFWWRRGWRTRRQLWAVRDVDLDVHAGESLAVVGESGSGKTTLALTLLRLHTPDTGSIEIDGEDWLALPPAELRARRADVQMVFQATAGALDPRWRIGAQIAEPLRIHRRLDAEDRPARVAELLELVDMPASLADRFPHQLSGGQRQRVGIARALATEPKLLVLDEPVSAIDVSVQARVLDLLARLRAKLGLTMIVISHDLAVVEQIADRVAVMYDGRIVELESTSDFFRAPAHPHSAALLAAVPRIEPGDGRHDR
ncbi:MAG: ABC transporter ATP-binding protein [Acidobacteriota bacterium]